MFKKSVVKKVLFALGGFKNIESFTNCGTRLRVNVKNTSVVDYEFIQKLSKVKGIIVEDQQIDVVFGVDTIKYANVLESLMV